MSPDDADAELTLNETAYRRIRHDIVTCRIEPGQRVSERRLADEYRFGLAAVRAALARLDQEGLVATEARRGYTIKPLTVKDVDRLFEFWRLLGPEIARLAVSRALPEVREQLAGATEDAVREDQPIPAVEGPVLAETDRVMAYLHVVAEHSDNEYAISAFRHISGDLSRLRYILAVDSLDAPGEPAATIATLIRAGDAEAVANLMQGYIDVLRSRIDEALRRLPTVLASEL